AFSGIVVDLKSDHTIDSIYKITALRKKMSEVLFAKISDRRIEIFSCVDDSNKSFEKITGRIIFHPIGISPQFIIAGFKRNGKFKRTAAATIIYSNFSLQNRLMHFVQNLHVKHFAYRKRPVVVSVFDIGFKP